MLVRAPGQPPYGDDMSEHRHGDDVHVTGTGDLGEGTRGHRSSSREHEPEILTA